MWNKSFFVDTCKMAVVTIRAYSLYELSLENNKSINLQYTYIDQSQPNTRANPNQTQGLFLGLLGVCSGSAFENLSPLWVHSGLTLGLFGNGFFWITVNTDVWSGPVFYLTFILPVVTAPGIFWIHTERCFQCYNSDRDLHSVSAFSLL